MAKFDASKRIKWSEEMLKYIKQIFHSKGVNGYKSPKAKEAFAESLMKLSDYCFVLAMTPLAGFYLKPQNTDFLFSLIMISLSLFMAMYLRHKSLEIIDAIFDEI